jgi:hypothetical protein
VPPHCNNLSVSAVAARHRSLMTPALLMKSESGAFPHATGVNLTAGQKGVWVAKACRSLAITACGLLNNSCQVKCTTL